MVHSKYREELFCILIFLLICLSGSIFQVLFFKYTFLMMSGCLFLLNLDFKKVQRTNFFTYCIFLFFIPIFIVLCNYLFTKSNTVSIYVVFLIQLAFAYFSFLTLKIHECNTERLIFLTVKFLSIYSLIGFFFSLFINGRFIQSSLGYKFYILFPFPFVKMAEQYVMGIKLWRNQGIFWEPGIMQIYANIYLFLTLFKYNSRKNIFFAFFTVVTTMSTTGLAIAALLIGIYVFKSKIAITKKIFLFIFAVIFSCLFLFSFSMKKTESEKNSISSYGLRIMDITDSFHVVKKYPLTGIGIDSDVYKAEKNNDFSEALMELLGQRGNSNGIASLLYQFGIPFFIFFIMILSNQTLIESHKKVFFWLFLICMCNEPILLTPFFMLFPLSAMEKIKIC